MKNMFEESTLGKVLEPFLAGSIASFLTQPLEVLKTNMIRLPSLTMKDVHLRIIVGGWGGYMKGSWIGVMRQGYGFAVYASTIRKINECLAAYE
jgi:hypothetical protein